MGGGRMRQVWMAAGKWAYAAGLDDDGEVDK